MAQLPAHLWISEILINPPGPDLPHEYIELRGTPNYILPQGTYFVAVEGDTNGNPGTVQNVFDLSGRAMGGNGFLVLLQNSNSYGIHTNCFALINNAGDGFGASTNLLRHRGEGGQTDLENNSATFFLIQTTNPPLPELDIDANNDGIPDGAAFASWTVLDSVGVLDNDGFGDIGYGLINFRRSGSPGNGATVVSGTIVPVGFTPIYVARSAHTTNWVAEAWVASGRLNGTAPNWTLDGSDTVPSAYGGRALNHLGGPNFGAANIPGVVVRETGFSTDLNEGSAVTDSYTLGLSTMPAGNVSVRINASAQVQVSIDAGATFGAARTVNFNDTSPVTVIVRVLDDNVVDASPHPAPIHHSIVATSDSANYPMTALGPVVTAWVIENDTALLSELKVNPPGTNDAPYEFVEVRGTPNALLTNVYFVVLEGNRSSNPGTVTAVFDLSDESFGSSGVLLIAADGNPYSVPSGARVVLMSELAEPGGALRNGSATFMLLSSLTPPVLGSDWDVGDNGRLALPFGATVLDSVGWTDGGNNDRVYTAARLVAASGAPDAATRYPGNTNANSVAAWVFGNLEGNDPASLFYADEATVPYGTELTPGSINNTAPRISAALAFSGVIGDPTNPKLALHISDAESPLSSLTLTVTSGNPAVVPDSNLTISGSGNSRTLSIDPVGIGYSTILISVSDGHMTGLAPVRYAASVDLRGGGRFHTGVSDASTAIALDAEYMLTGDDENQILRIYSRSNSGLPFVEFDLNPFLDLRHFYANGTPREIDVEGSTRVGHRIYWLGSHSHSVEFESRTNRSRLFTTDISGSGTNITFSFVGRYDYLKIDVMAWDAANGHGRGSNYYGLTLSGAEGVDAKAPDGRGFNFEGLALAPGSTTVAYLGFRAPIIPATNRSRALVVPLLNFAALAATNNAAVGSAIFGEPIELNLGGRGIRSFEGNSHGYLIVAGPPGFATGIPPSDFRIYTWDGLPGSQPQERGAWLEHLLPEGIVELPPGPWTADTRVQLLSDNGIALYYGDGIDAKFLPYPAHKKFRSDWVTLGPVVTSRPVIKEIRREGVQCAITWYSVAGLTYRLQSKDSLSDASWSNVPGDVVATDSLTTKSVPTVPGRRFFRLIIP